MSTLNSDENLYDDEEGTYQSASIDHEDDDLNTPKWPNNGIPSNRWYTGLHAFIYALQHQFTWFRSPNGHRAKYVNIRIDTRNGNFLAFIENDKGECTRMISPDELGIEFRPIKLLEK